MDTAATISFLFLGIPAILALVLAFAIGFLSGWLYAKLSEALALPNALP